VKAGRPAFAALQLPVSTGPHSLGQCAAVSNILQFIITGNVFFLLSHTRQT